MRGNFFWERNPAVADGKRDAGGWTGFNPPKVWKRHCSIDGNRIIKYPGNRSVGGIFEEIGSPHHAIAVFNFYGDLFFKKCSSSQYAGPRISKPIAKWANIHFADECFEEWAVYNSILQWLRSAAYQRQRPAGQRVGHGMDIFLPCYQQREAKKISKRGSVRGISAPVLLVKWYSIKGYYPIQNPLRWDTPRTLWHSGQK